MFKEIIFSMLFALLQNSPDTVQKLDTTGVAPQREIVVCDSLEFAVPELVGDDELLYHTAYAFVYSEKHEQSKWVAYRLTKARVESSAERSNEFRPDGLVVTGTADNADYYKSGYDKGHLAPAADMGWSQTTMKESFYFSNMSPQLPSFNRGVWKRLETKVRKWASEYEGIYVVTGPILTDSLPTIGGNKVAVPQYFYKIIYDYTLPEIKAIAFIIPNRKSSADLRTFAVTIDEVEKATGINFFPSLSQEHEREIEGTICVPCWTW